MMTFNDAVLIAILTMILVILPAMIHFAKSAEEKGFQRGYQHGTSKLGKMQRRIMELEKQVKSSQEARRSERHSHLIRLIVFKRLLGAEKFNRIMQARVDHGDREEFRKRGYKDVSQP